MLDDNNQPDPAQAEAQAPEGQAPEAPAAETQASDTPAAEAEAPAATAKKSARKAPAKKAAAKKAPARKTAAKRAPAKKAAASPEDAPPTDEAPVLEPPAGEPPATGVPEALATETPGTTSELADAPAAPAKKAAARKTAAKTTTTTRKAAARKAPAKKAAAAKSAEPAPAEETAAEAVSPEAPVVSPEAPAAEAATAPTAAPLFQAPVAKTVTTRRTRTAKKAAAPAPAPADSPDADEEVEEETTGEVVEAAVTEATEAPEATEAAEAAEATEAEGAAEAAEDETADEEAEAAGEGAAQRRRRRRGGRRRRKAGGSQGNGEAADSDEDETGEDAADTEAVEATDSEDADAGENGEDRGESTSSRRRRRRRRASDDAADSDDEPNTVTRVRSARSAEDQITAVSGSTRLEAKKQRRREGREAGRRRAPIVSEAEFLARRESVERVMVIRQRQDLTQIAVLEDKVLVEHYVARESQTSLIGNVYLGRVQNVLPSMEAAFIDIGKGRNAVLYAGEVNWSALGHKEGQPRKIESVLSSGQSILVQVTKDPVGHKGARLTSQISLAGRFLVYVPDGTTSGISRKLPDTERNRLKALLKEIVPDSAGVIVRTAAEGASEEELTRDVERLKARWEDIEAKAKGNAPQLLYGEPDLTLKVVRDLFTEDFTKLVIQGDDAWETVQGYVEHVAPDLKDRLEKFQPGENGKDVFAVHRIEEQIQKGLDRKVWLPSGGSLIIDRTEAMTVVDVNTGKFTGSGGNLEETVTKNNLEAAEEIVRQLRLRDIGGIIVIDFIDMVLESNRDLVVRRLVECLGRDRTRHQVAEVTSLGLVQMTRKRIGTGLLEAFSKDCEHCHGRGVVILDAPVEPSKADEERGGRRSRGRGRGNAAGGNGNGGQPTPAPSPKEVASLAQAKHEEHAAAPDEAPAKPTEAAAETPAETPVETPAPASPEPGVAHVEPGPASEPAVVEAPAAQQPVAEPVLAAEPVVDAEPVRDAEPVLEAEPLLDAEPLAEPESAEELAGEAAIEPVEPAKPRVVTRTRGRAASRPAGPPTGALGTPAPAQVEPGTAGHEPGTDAAAVPEPHVEHVPIKKKGSRKR